MNVILGLGFMLMAIVGAALLYFLLIHPKSKKKTASGAKDKERQSSKKISKGISGKIPTGKQFSGKPNPLLIASPLKLETRFRLDVIKVFIEDDIDLVVKILRQWMREK